MHMDEDVSGGRAARAPLFVSAAWVAEHLQEGDLVVVDCRFTLGDASAGKAAYDRGHIPGAHYASLEDDLSGPVVGLGGRHPLPDPAVFSAFVTRCGVRASTTVVAYDENGEMAARLWWLLQYHGHARVSVLEGGWGAWTAARLPVSTEPAPRFAAAPLYALKPDPTMVVTREQVRASLAHGDMLLVDARAPDRFRGEQEPLDRVPGHIPGAINRFWRDALSGPARLRPEAELREHFAELTVGQPVVLYCGSGVTAAVNALALERIGLPYRLYAGSYSDWCALPDTPIASGED